MAKDPAVLFYTADFLTGTAFFTYVERGQYITLLCEQHQLRAIPEHHIVDVCGSLDSQVAKKFIKDVDGTYYNVRMRRESDRRFSYCESRRKSIQTRYINNSHEDTHVTHTDSRMETETETDNEIRNKRVQGEKNKSRFTKPTIEEVKTYCLERKNHVNHQGFFDFYESKGWVVGKSPMKSWQAAVRTWERNDYGTVNTSKPKQKEPPRFHDTIDHINDLGPCTPLTGL